MGERHQAPWAEGVLFERLAVGDYAAFRIRTKPEHGVAREEPRPQPVRGAGRIVGQTVDV
jgi:hypothetical protein